MTVAEALRHGATRLAGIEGGALDARWLLAHLMGVDNAALGQTRNASVPDPAAFDALLDRRAAREPVALITGRQGFWTLDLEVSPATLIPRPESETLIEAALAVRPDRTGVRRILDLGTGTGCLLLAALAEFPNAWGLGIDINPEAAALARRNATRNGLSTRTAFAAGNWADALSARFDLILSNPPYIPESDLATLMPDVRDHEPHQALNGGPDGLTAYRALLATLPRLLAPNGIAIFELGIGQADPVSYLAAQSGFHTQTRPDLAAISRALVLHIPPCNPKPS